MKRKLLSLMKRKLIQRDIDRWFVISRACPISMAAVHLIVHAKPIQMVVIKIKGIQDDPAQFPQGPNAADLDRPEHFPASAGRVNFQCILPDQFVLFRFELFCQRICFFVHALFSSFSHQRHNSTVFCFANYRTCLR